MASDDDRASSSVHILRTEEELEAALRRASEFDSRVRGTLPRRYAR